MGEGRGVEGVRWGRGRPGSGRGPSGGLVVLGHSVPPLPKLLEAVLGGPGRLLRHRAGLLPSQVLPHQRRGSLHHLRGHSCHEHQELRDGE